jgi:hypothetical protein
MKTLTFYINVGMCSILLPILAKAGIQDLRADSTRWSTVAGISIQAVCYTDLSFMRIKDPDTQAIIRVYLMNDLDHSVIHLASNIDHGLKLSAIGADGQVSYLRNSDPTVEGRPTPLLSNKCVTYNIALNDREKAFLNNGSLIVSTRVFDPSSKQVITVHCPIVIN